SMSEVPRNWCLRKTHNPGLVSEMPVSPPLSYIFPPGGLSETESNAVAGALRKYRFVCLRSRGDGCGGITGGDSRTREAGEIVLLGGHLDSWDVEQCAQDDGAGIVASMEAMAFIHKL